MNKERCAIFIDGGYLDKLLKNWKFNNLDYKKFCDKMCVHINANLLRVYYYNCIPIIRKMHKVRCKTCNISFELPFEPRDEEDVKCEKCYKGKRPQRPSITPELTRDDEERLERKKIFFNKLKKLPRFEVKFGRITLLDGKFKQKGVDVLMSLDIVDKCFEKQIQHVILVAGDSDFIPAIRKAKDYGAIVHLFCSKNKLNRELLYEIDEFHPIGLKFLKLFEEDQKNIS